MAMQTRRPESDLTTFRSVFDRFFDDAGSWLSSAEVRLPLDITSSEDAITIEAALPGIRQEDVDITVHQDTLTIKVKDESEETGGDGKRVYREVRRSRGSRTVTLPSGLDLDRAQATLDNGMLRIVLPRGEEAKPRKIQIGQR